MKKNTDPVRMCCACRQRKQKSQLWRIVLQSDGAVWDPSGRADGRGLYVCRDPQCLQRLKRRKSGMRQVSLQTLRDVCDVLLRRVDQSE